MIIMKNNIEEDTAYLQIQDPKYAEAMINKLECVLQISSMVRIYFFQ